MTDASRTPDRIWAWRFHQSAQNYALTGGWHDQPDDGDNEYIREDISLAREAAAYEAAANEVDCGQCGGTCANHSNCHSKDAAIIRALTPADAQAALDRLIAEAEERGFWAGRSCGGAKAEIDAALAAIRNRRKGGE
jgi:hypothetical protein